MRRPGDQLIFERGTELPRPATPPEGQRAGLSVMDLALKLEMLEQIDDLSISNDIYMHGIINV